MPHSPTRLKGGGLLGGLEAIDPLPGIVRTFELDQRTGHDLACLRGAMSIAPAAGIRELHLMRVLAAMVSDDLPVRTGHRRHRARGFPNARYDMTA
jgi:hypothetical protein